MAPKSSPPQSSSSQGKKQSHISSFFARKPSRVAKPLPPEVAAPVLDVPAKESNQERVAASSDEEDSLPLPRANATRRKRVIDEEGDEDVGGASKRVRSSAIDMSRNEYRPSLGQVSTTSLNAPKAPKISDRTSKFIFSSSPVVLDENDNEEDAMAAQKQKQKLHEQFVRKLGRPDSFAELRRKNKILSEETVEGEGEGEGEEEDEEPAPKPTKGKKATSKSAVPKLTPMDKQYLDIKRKHLDTIIVMEVGYKFKIYGEDARIASKELGIVCIPGKFRYDERKFETKCFSLLSYTDSTRPIRGSLLKIRLRQLPSSQTSSPCQASRSSQS